MDSGDQHIARDIWEAWQAGAVVDGLAQDGRPRTRAEAYTIQAHLEAFSGAPRAGWKIAATSAAGQAHINVDGPLAGRVFAETLVPDGAEISLTGNRMRVAEPEFAFRFGSTLTPRERRWETEEVLDHVANLLLTIELPDSRFEDFVSVGGLALIADNACTGKLVVGPEVRSDWRAMDLSRHTVTCTVGERYTRDGIGSNVLGDPRTALTWCVNELSSLGIGITAGEFVTTGTMAVPLELEPGDHVTCDHGAFGTISVHLKD